MKTKSEASRRLRQTFSNWTDWLLQIVDLRVAVVMGVSIFLLAVGVDSSGNYATAAELGQAPIQITQATSSAKQTHQQQRIQPQSKTEPEVSYLEFDPAIANRLRQGDITSASLTSSRLTKAHFFTDSFRVASH